MFFIVISQIQNSDGPVLRKVGYQALANLAENGLAAWLEDVKQLDRACLKLYYYSVSKVQVLVAKLVEPVPTPGMPA